MREKDKITAKQENKERKVNSNKVCRNQWIQVEKNIFKNIKSTQKQYCLLQNIPFCISISNLLHKRASHYGWFIFFCNGKLLSIAKFIVDGVGSLIYFWKKTAVHSYNVPMYPIKFYVLAEKSTRTNIYTIKSSGRNLYWLTGQICFDWVVHEIQYPLVITLL